MRSSATSSRPSALVWPNTIFNSKTLVNPSFKPINREFFRLFEGGYKLRNFNGERRELSGFLAFESQVCGFQFVST